jgi:hypothetical protein
MNGKMLLKITLNEAIDPDLFAYLSQFDNARLRAGAFRSIASSAARARNNAAGTNADKVDRVARDSPSLKAEAPASTISASTLTAPARETTTAAFVETPQFLVDDIGDQFANF